MSPLLRTTVATAATASMALLGFSECCSSSLYVVAIPQQQTIYTLQKHRRTEGEFGIGNGNNDININSNSESATYDTDSSRIGVQKGVRSYGEGYIPPWRDPDSAESIILITSPSLTATEWPTSGPTGSPTEPPTVSPTTLAPTVSPTTLAPTTIAPTVAPTLPTTTASPTRSPIAITAVPTSSPIAIATATTPAPFDTTIEDTSGNATDTDELSGADLRNTTINEETGATETSCVLLPSIGTYVTEVLDIEYFLYLAGDDGDDADAIQNTVRSSVEPKLHDSLVDLGMGCQTSDFFAAKHSMVALSSSGMDFVGSECDTDMEEILGLAASHNATAVCHKVWGRVEATMWFSPRRQRERQRQRTLQAPSATPFGDREAFIHFTRWMEDAFESLGADESVSDDDASILGASFLGYTNVNNVDGNLFDAHQTNVGVDHTAAFMGTAYSVDDDGFNLVFGLIVVIAGVMVLSFAILFVVVRRNRNQTAVLEHARCVDELRLDSNDDLELNPDVVDDASLFREEHPLPDDYKVTMEDGHHDYRICANPSCKLCRVGGENKKPIFVATDPRKEFCDHLSVLRDKQESEERERTYESVLL